MPNTQKEPRGSFFIPARFGCGFTLPELAIVIVVVSVLAVVALPRLTRATFDEARLHQEALAALRYAQRTAVTRQRTVCVSVGATTVTLRYRSLYGNNACTYDTGDANLPAPSGTGAATTYTVTAQGSAAITTPVNFYFNLLGQPSAGQSITLSDGRIITVEAESGYVH